MTLKFFNHNFIVFLLLFFISHFTCNINGEITTNNDTKQEECCDDQEISISMRDLFGICAGIIVAAPPIIVLIILLTYQRDSIKVRKTNKYSKLETVSDNVDNKYKNDKDSINTLSSDAAGIELSTF
uniref:Plasmodium vivax Vir protein n=1 Tax=Strongyloides papillosus TaxID=174720 RepID=A0A0N5C7T9_STREA